MTRGRVLPVLLQVLLGLLAIAATQPSSSPSHPGGGGGQQPASHHHSQPARHQGSSQHRRHHPRQKEGAMDISALPEPERKHFLDALESNLMTTFGITRKPKSKQGRTIHIPKRMQLLYEQLNGYGEGTLEEQLQRRRNRVRRAPGNTIRSFSYTDLGNVTGGLNIGFDMNSFPDTESLNEAHLQILHKPTEDTHQQLHNQSDSSHVIDIYQVIQPESQSRSSSSGESITRLVDTKTVQSRQHKWHTFDISSAVHEWRKTPGVNHGLQVSVRTAEGRKSPFAGHVRLRRSAQQADMEWAADQPYVITYGDDGKDRHKRDKKDKKRTRRSKKKNKKRRRRRRNICKRHELYVDFRDVGWNDWIVAPPGYDAFYCHGDCPFYLPDNLNTTNHAVVQSLVHSVNPQAVPKPCCVPTELSPMSMLYMNYDDNVVLKTYRDMVVEACGCR